MYGLANAIAMKPVACTKKNSLLVPYQGIIQLQYLQYIEGFDYPPRLAMCQWFLQNTTMT